MGGRPDALVVAWDKSTGKELWRALAPGQDMGYGQPVIVEVGGVRQLIVWHPEALFSLAPESGKELWRQPMRVHLGMTVATPVISGGRLLVSSPFYNGSMLPVMTPGAARMLWRGKSESEINTDGLHAVVSRTAFMKPTTNSGNGWELGAVNWSHRAYANRHVVARNDEEIVRCSLARE